MEAMTGSPTSRRRGRPVRVSRDELVAAGSRMLAEGGAAAFSMRKLASELDVSTAAIYHHFPTRAQLFIAVLSARAAELDRPELPADPRERLIAITMHLAESIQRFPWVVELLISGEFFGRAAFWILDEFINAATELGATDEYAGYMYNAAWRYVIGELLMRRAEDERRAAEQQGTHHAHWTEEVDAEEIADFPTVVRLLPKWVGIRDGYNSRTAVEHLIDGLLRGSKT